MPSTNSSPSPNWMVVTSEANLERSIAEKEACIEAVEDVLSKMKELAAELQRNLQQQQ